MNSSENEFTLLIQRKLSLFLAGCHLSLFTKDRSRRTGNFKTLYQFLRAVGSQEGEVGFQCCGSCAREMSITVCGLVLIIETGALGRATSFAVWIMQHSHWQADESLLVEDFSVYRNRSLNKKS